LKSSNVTKLASVPNRTSNKVESPSIVSQKTNVVWEKNIFIY